MLFSDFLSTYDDEEEDTEEDPLPASPMSVKYLSPEKPVGEGFAAPEKAVECAASSKMKGRRIAMILVKRM